MKDKPLVSVCVIAYNHAKYIKQTLDSILSQKTEFGVEILVHDDASTDGTIDILKKYEAKYHDFMRVFYEDENQWGKNVYRGGYRGLLTSVARGKYIAVCEGDDYWVDSGKLQKQVSYLEAHSDCSFSCHAASVFDGETAKLICIMGMGDCEHDLTSQELITNWNVPTASWVYRKGLFDSMQEDWPGSFPVGDFPSVLYASTVGLVHYFPETMSAYRYQTPGSWTSNLNSIKKRVCNAHRWLQMYGAIDGFTEMRWHKAFLIASRPSLRLILSVGRASHLTEFERDVRTSLCLRDWMAIAAKRVLRRLGYSIEPKGFGKNAGRKIVKVQTIDE